MPEVRGGAGAGGDWPGWGGLQRYVVNTYQFNAEMAGLNPKYTGWWYLVLAAFGVVELCALFDKRKGDTFTEHVRYWLSLQSRTAWAGRAFAVVFLGWLCWHFLYPVK